MRYIDLGETATDHVQAIRDFFTWRNLSEQKVRASGMRDEMIWMLNRRPPAAEVAELFYGAAKAFHEMDIFKPRERLDFRDDCVDMLAQWIAQDFDAQDHLEPFTITRLYGAFTFLEYRMPAYFHRLMEQKLYDLADDLKVPQAQRVLGYYARTADQMSQDTYDICTKLVLKEPNAASLERQVKFLSHIAMLDSIYKDTEMFHHVKPKDIYDAVQKSMDPEDLQNSQTHIAMRLANEWFKREFHFVRSGKPKEAANSLSQRIANQPGVIVENFNRQAQDKKDIANKGIDFKAQFGEAGAVSVVFDTRTSYVATLGANNILMPNGKAYFHSAKVEMDNPDEVIVRVSGSIARILQNEELIATLKKASHMPHGVYGINNRQEVVPLPELKFAV